MAEDAEMTPVENGDEDKVAPMEGKFSLLNLVSHIRPDR
jgi:hypothetical protein